MYNLKMERRVIIRGHVFDFQEKAPFVTSGQSVLGAVEYDSAIDRVKCHECGDWFTYISGSHLRSAHKLTNAAYRARHGLNVKSPLCGPNFSAMRRSQRPAPTAAQVARLVEAGREHKRVHGNNLTNRPKHEYESANANGRCQAQTLFRLQVLAAELGRTPTALEMQAARLDQPLLVRNFGHPRTAITLAGLKPRPGGRPVDGSADVACALPVGFPSKDALLKQKEPWFSTARCSERACIFPATPSGLCRQHQKMFHLKDSLGVYSSQSSLSVA